MNSWVQESPLGPLSVTMDDGGIRSVELGARPDAAGGVPVDDVSSALGAYFAGDLQALDGMAVDLGGRSVFCREVLAALRRVRPGRVVSYGWLGAEVGRPGAARAVGRALGSNPVPIVVPCHRVLAGDGSLGGYSGGLATKRWLLAHEGWPGAATGPAGAVTGPARGATGPARAARASGRAGRRAQPGGELPRPRRAGGGPLRGAGGT